MKLVNPGLWCKTHNVIIYFFKIRHIAAVAKISWCMQFPGISYNLSGQKVYSPDHLCLVKKKRYSWNAHFSKKLNPRKPIWFFPINSLFLRRFSLNLPKGEAAFQNRNRISPNDEKN